MYTQCLLLQSMFGRKKPDPRLAELEAENRNLKHEIENIKRENTDLREANGQLRLSLDELVKKTKPQPPPPRSPKPSNSKPHTSSEAANRRHDSDLQRKLAMTIRQLSETRHQLMSVQDELTVVKQVTAATQIREMQQEGVYENLPADSVYQNLRSDPIPKHVHAASAMHTGCILTYSFTDCFSSKW